MKINDVKAIVTGANGGIGSEIVRDIINNSGIVGSIYRHDYEEDIAGNPIKCVIGSYPLKCDISSEVEVKKAFEDFYNEFGTPNVLINNAGVLLDEPIVSITKNGINQCSLDKWNKTIGINLTGSFLCIREFVSYQVENNIKNSLIINISSVSRNGNSGQSAYSSSKGGLASLTFSLAKELTPLKIRVVGVAPGLVDTNMSRSIPESYLKNMIKNTCAKRIGNPKEIAHAVKFCIENDFFSGKILEIDGGVFNG